MQTLYIDVYFLINFTVDLVALHLASEFTKVKITSLRLVTFSLLLSIAACSEIFLPNTVISGILVNLLCILLVFFTPKRGLLGLRRFRFFLSAYILLMLIGGIVYSLFDYLKRYADIISIEQNVNRRLLMLAVIILISIGCVKLFVSILKDVKCEKIVKLKIFMNEKEAVVECFVDTGNFLKDPIDMTPVILLKEHAVKNLFSGDIPTDISAPSLEKHTNIRLIPIGVGGETEIRIGFRPKRSVIITERGERETVLSFIIDNERGSFGGYAGLAPASLIE